MTKEEVINILKYELSHIPDDAWHPNILQHKDFCKTVLEELEERPTGEWVWTSYNPYDENIGRWSCSICNYEPDGKLIDENVHYCPNCGADMQGGK